MKFQIALPILLRSRTLFALFFLTFLFSIYLVIQYKDSLMFLETKGRCLSIL